MRVTRLVLGALSTNCYVVFDDDGAHAIVIDPADSAPTIREAVGGAHLAGVVLTHGHFDHLEAARELVETSGAPLCVHELDARNIMTPEGTGGALFGFNVSAPPADRGVKEGDLIRFGTSSLTVLHTPGHTPGSMCLHGDGCLFSGDTLFAGSVGRTDFPGGSARDLSRSIASRIATLPDATTVYPGHGPSTTIGRERQVNPFFPRTR